MTGSARDGGGLRARFECSRRSNGVKVGVGGGCTDNAAVWVTALKGGVRFSGDGHGRMVSFVIADSLQRLGNPRPYSIHFSMSLLTTAV